MNVHIENLYLREILLYFFLINVVKKLENINDNNIITVRYQLTLKHSTEMVTMHQNANMKFAGICKSFSQHRTAPVDRDVKKSIGDNSPLDKRKVNLRRPNYIYKIKGKC